MIGVFVRFRYGSDFDEQALRGIAAAASARFEAMPHLHAKAFTIDSSKREATNFYIWESMEAARAFFDAALVERLTGLYGARPDIEFVEIAALVENFSSSPPSRNACTSR